MSAEERREQLAELLEAEYERKKELDKQFLLPLTRGERQELNQELEKLTKHVLDYIAELSSLNKELNLLVDPADKYEQLNGASFSPFIPVSFADYEDACHQEARNYLDAKDYEQALKTFRQAIEANPEKADYYQGCGDVYRQWGDSLYVSEPNKAEIFAWNFVTVFHSLQKFDLMDDSFNEDEPIKAESCFLRAIKNYDRALEIDPSSHTSYYKRALTQVYLKDYMMALADLQRAIALEPELEYYLKYKEWKDTYYQLLLENLKDKNNHDRWQHFYPLGMLATDQPRLNLIAVWNKNESYYPVSALTRLGGQAIEPLIEALTDTNSNVRSSAASVLGELEDYWAVEPLIEALKDTDASVRLAAVSALGKLEDRRAIEPLAEALKDEDSRVRFQVASVLARLGDKRAVEPSLEALKDEETVMRSHIISMLGYTKDSRAVEPLLAFLKDESAMIRHSTVTALGDIGDIQAVEPLIEALKDEDSQVRSFASLYLGMLGDSRAVEPLIKALKDFASEVRFYAAQALGQLENTQAIEPLTVALSDEVKMVCYSAAIALAQLGDKQAIKYLINALNIEALNDDEAKGMCVYAAYKLGELEDIRALPALEEIYQGGKAKSLSKNQKEIFANAIVKIKAKNGLT